MIGERSPSPPLSVPYQAAGPDQVADVVLHSLEPHETAGLTLEMIDEGSQGLELHPATALGAVIEVLLIDGRVDVLVQSAERVE